MGGARRTKGLGLGAPARLSPRPIVAPPPRATAVPLVQQSRPLSSREARAPLGATPTMGPPLHPSPQARGLGPDAEAWAEAAFAALVAAYETLGTPDKRAAFDDFGGGGAEAGAFETEWEFEQFGQASAGAALFYSGHPLITTLTEVGNLFVPFFLCSCVGLVWWMCVSGRAVRLNQVFLCVCVGGVPVVACCGSGSGRSGWGAETRFGSWSFMHPGAPTVSGRSTFSKRCGDSVWVLFNAPWCSHCQRPRRPLQKGCSGGGTGVDE